MANMLTESPIKSPEFVDINSDTLLNAIFNFISRYDAKFLDTSQVYSQALNYFQRNCLSTTETIEITDIYSTTADSQIWRDHVNMQGAEPLPIKIAQDEHFSYESLILDGKFGKSDECLEVEEVFNLSNYFYADLFLNHLFLGESRDSLSEFASTRVVRGNSNDDEVKNALDNLEKLLFTPQGIAYKRIN